MKTRLFVCSLAVAALFVPGSVQAEEVGTDEDVAARLTPPWTGAAGTGIALAYESGSWGGAWSQGVRLRVPLGKHFGVHVRGLTLGDPATDRWDFGGRLDLVGQSEVILNVMRLYGGGGVQVFRPVSGDVARKAHVGGGGHFGFEFFMSEWMSWIVEIGGNSGSEDGFGAGATVIAGVQFHPFAL